MYSFGSWGKVVSRRFRPLRRKNRLQPRKPCQVSRVCGDIVVCVREHGGTRPLEFAFLPSEVYFHVGISVKTHTLASLFFACISTWELIFSFYTLFFFVPEARDHQRPKIDHILVKLVFSSSCFLLRSRPPGPCLRREGNPLATEDLKPQPVMPKSFFGPPSPGQQTGAPG